MASYELSHAPNTIRENINLKPVPIHGKILEKKFQDKLKEVEQSNDKIKMLGG